MQTNPTSALANFTWANMVCPKAKHRGLTIAVQRVATIDDFLACSGANIRERSGEAFYRPGDDVISLPNFAAFKSAAHFYSTTFHELGQSYR
jgi:antirestriction protein ArdC